MVWGFGRKLESNGLYEKQFCIFYRGWKKSEILGG